MGVEQTDSLLLEPNRRILYYWSRTEGFFTIGAEQKDSLLLEQNRRILYYIKGCTFAAVETLHAFDVINLALSPDLAQHLEEIRRNGFRVQQHALRRWCPARLAASAVAAAGLRQFLQPCTCASIFPSLAMTCTLRV